MTEGAKQGSRYRDKAKGWSVRGSNPGRDNKFFPSPKRSDRLWDPLSLLFNEYRVFLPRVKRAEREANYPPPSNTEVKNEWSDVPSWYGEGHLWLLPNVPAFSEYSLPKFVTKVICEQQQARIAERRISVRK
jgi:hypothetical protein